VLPPGNFASILDRISISEYVLFLDIPSSGFTGFSVEIGFAA
jgi:hypothetical protein